MSALVEQANKDIEQQQINVQEISEKIGQDQMGPSIQRKISQSGYMVYPATGAPYTPGTYPPQPGIYPPQQGVAYLPSPEATGSQYPYPNLDVSELQMAYAGQ